MFVGKERDVSVERLGDALDGRKVLLGITGGIAATQSVKLLRELRRYGAVVDVVMSRAAQRIITPLAVEWAADCDIITDWESSMTPLEEIDAILVAPATRNLMAKHAHGVMDSPLLMALSAARARQTPTLFVPSMHADLMNDPLTAELQHQSRLQGTEYLWNKDEEEGKRKQPDEVEIVAQFCHLVNRTQDGRRQVVVTLGSTRSRLDDIRFIQNTSSGATGYGIAENLHRHGHEVTVVAGCTSVQPGFELPLVIDACDPDEMLAELRALTTCGIDAWIHAAAVLDYLNPTPQSGKHPSGEDEWSLTLRCGPKHLAELAEATSDAVRIGFKLESGISLKDLLMRAGSFAEHQQLTAVVANRLEDMDSDSKPRAHLVLRGGENFMLEDEASIAEALRRLIESSP